MRTAAALFALLISPSPAGLPFADGLRDLAMGEEDVRILGDDPGGRLGAALAVGDLNGDGFTDLAMGAPEADQDDGELLQAGEVAVIFGQANFNATIDLSAAGFPADQRVLGGEAFSDFGLALAIGDFNGDGFDDLAIGAPEDDGDAQSGARSGAGAVFLVFGGENPARTVDTALGREDVRILGGSLGVDLGRSLAAGDIDADGIDDLVIGIPEQDASETGRVNMGEAAILWGRALWPSRIDMATFQSGVTIIRGDDSGDRLGTDVAVGDVDGDGYPDVIAGAIGGDNGSVADTGEADLVRGGPDLPRLPQVIDLMDSGVGMRVLGDDDQDLAGQALAVGDVNADGCADLILGVPGGDGSDVTLSEEDAGEVSLWRGRTALPATVDLSARQDNVRVLGSEVDDELGTDVVALDLDGDGRDDLATSRPDEDPGDPTRVNAGEVLVFRADQLQTTATIDLDTDSPDLSVIGARASDLTGTALAAGDLNRDGFTDLILGAADADPGPEASRRFQAGEVSIIFGGSLLTTAERRQAQPPGETPPQRFGPVLRVSLAFDAGERSETDATLTREAPAGLANAAAVRWTIETDRTGHTQAAFVFRYTDAEIMGLAEDALTLFSAPAATGPWSPLPTSIDTLRNEASAMVGAAALGAQPHFGLATGASSADVLAFLLGMTMTAPAGADANGDGRVDVADVVWLVNRGR